MMDISEKTDELLSQIIQISWLWEDDRMQLAENIRRRVNNTLMQIYAEISETKHEEVDE